MTETSARVRDGDAVSADCVAPPTHDAVEPPPARVLVVDDDAANRESLSRRLARRGYAVETAADGRACLEAVRASPFDAVLLDVQMPGMSGLEALAEIRRERSRTDLPVIMATARSESADVVEALNLGANDYVTKPLDFPVVVARVETQVALARAAREVAALTRALDARNAELEAANAGLLRAAKRGRQELALASRVQASSLPRPWGPDEPVAVAWRYEPCAELAGDALNAFRLDAEHVAFYVLDVSGHGVAAALTAVSVARLLSPGHDPNSILVGRTPGGGTDGPTAPAEVVAELARRFAWNEEIAQFVTLFYGVLHLPTRTLRYASAGHPGPLLIRRGEAPRGLESTGLPIGVGAGGEAAEERTVPMAAGDRLYAFTDGVTEAADAGGDQYGSDRLAARLDGASDAPLDATLADVLDVLRRWRCDRPSIDDVTILAIELA